MQMKFIFKDKLMFIPAFWSIKNLPAYKAPCRYRKYNVDRPKVSMYAVFYTVVLWNKQNLSGL
jgi:hypothetical protein